MLRYNSAMGRDAEPVELNSTDLIEFANSLRIVATMIEADVESMRQRGIEVIQPKLWRSALKASTDLAKFAGAIHTSIASHSFLQSPPAKAVEPSPKPLQS